MIAPIRWKGLPFHAMRLRVSSPHLPFVKGKRDKTQPDDAFFDNPPAKKRRSSIASSTKVCSSKVEVEFLP
jgi:hypothetical protein